MAVSSVQYGAMKMASVSQLRDHLSHYLREVEQGERVIVSRRGRVVAELRPATQREVEQAGEGLAARLHQLEQEGFLRRGRGQWPEDSAELRGAEPLPLVEVLLAERAEGP